VQTRVGIGLKRALPATDLSLLPHLFRVKNLAHTGGQFRRAARRDLRAANQTPARQRLVVSLAQPVGEILLKLAVVGLTFIGGRRGKAFSISERKSASVPRISEARMQF